MGNATRSQIAAAKKLLNKSFWDMTSEEKEAEAEIFKNIRFEDTRPLTPAERKRWARARKPGRPKVGQGAVRVPFSMEFGLLKALDVFARERGMTRSGLIAAAVREYMTRAGTGRGKSAINGQATARRARTAHGAVVK